MASTRVSSVERQESRAGEQEEEEEPSRQAARGRCPLLDPGRLCGIPADFPRPCAVQKSLARLVGSSPSRLLTIGTLLSIPAEGEKTAPAEERSAMPSDLGIDPAELAAAMF